MTLAAVREGGRKEGREAETEERKGQRRHGTETREADTWRKPGWGGGEEKGRGAEQKWRQKQ